MQKRYAGLAVVLVSLVAFGVAHADFLGVIDPKGTVTRIDSVTTTNPIMTFLTPGWGTKTPYDSFPFVGVSYPDTIRVHGTINGIPTHKVFWRPAVGESLALGFGVVTSYVRWYGEIGIEEAGSVVKPQQRLTVSPSVVTGQMTIRLQPVGTGSAVVQVHDAVGNVIRSLNCTAGANGTATVTWNREDDFGRLVPEGVYFCRYAATGAAAVRKVLVAH